MINTLIKYRTKISITLQIVNFQFVRQTQRMKKSEVREIAMKENIAAKLTGKDDKYACALADKIILAHITDEKPITARQCIKALAQVGSVKPQYIPVISSCLRSADLSKYKDSMRPLIEKDIAKMEKKLTS